MKQIKSKKKSFIMLSVSILFIAFSQGYAQTTDFSGTWKRNDEKTVSPGLSTSSIPTIIEIKQNGTTVIIKQTSIKDNGEFLSYTETIRLDGSTTETITPSKLKRYATVQWSADEKELTETFNAKDEQGNIAQTGTQAFSLTNDGKTLKIAAMQSYGDKNFVMDESYNKQ